MDVGNKVASWIRSMVGRLHSRLQPPSLRPLFKKVEDTAEAVRTERATGDRPKVRSYRQCPADVRGSNRERGAVARIDAPAATSTSPPLEGACPRARSAAWSHS